MQEPESVVQECPDKTAPPQERVDQNETKMHSSVLITHELGLGEVSRLCGLAGLENNSVLVASETDHCCWPSRPRDAAQRSSPVC